MIFAADVVAAKQIFDQTLKENKDIQRINDVVSKSIENHIGKMKIAPDYRVKIDIKIKIIF